MRLAPIALMVFLSASAVAPEMRAQSAADSSTVNRHHAKAKTSGARKPAAKTKTKKSTRSTKGRAARSAKLKQAFVASTELRPMAQQLATTRTAAAYAGVTAYAHQHSGEAAAAAYLALGHAYLLDNRFTEATTNLRQARATGDALADYAEYLGAKAEHDGGNDSAAEALIKGFAERNPDSIFDNQVPELEAQILLGLNDFAGARRVLDASPEASGRAGYQLALAEVTQAQGQTGEAGRLYKHVLLTWPLTYEATTARSRLTAMGMESTMTAAELRSLGDAYYNGGRYVEASEQYHALARQSGADATLRNGYAVAAAACDLKLKRLTREQAEALAPTNDENGARRLYLLMELARNRDDLTAQTTYVDLLGTSFPHSQWLAEALFSSGNLYLLRKDYPQAITYYSDLAARFPTHRYAPSSHWKAAWLNYRLGNYSAAAVLFDKQIALYAGGKEIPAALYWRGRLYADQEHEPAMAAAYYQTVSRVFEHYYYAQLSRDRLAELGSVTPADVAMLNNIKREEIPALTDDVPEDDEHVIKARLLANAGLNEYIPAEIQAADGSEQWGAFAEAEIYSSDGETFRAMRVLKKALPFYTSAPIDTIPMGYWKILFPQQYWSSIEQGAAKNGLSPYMVASLIRQESEFNPGAISNRNAFGLMQLLPSVGRSMAREEGIRHFNEVELLNPDTNIRLGSRYLKQTLDKFDGQPAYAFAAYNAGDSRVTDWQSIGKYHGMDEFVESIPFTETRDYVQAILRNESIYRALHAAEAPAPPSAVAQQKPSGAIAQQKPSPMEQKMMPAQQ